MSNREESHTLLSSGDGQHDDSGDGRDEAKHVGISGYLQSLWRTPGDSRGKAPLPLLSRPASPEEAPLLESSRERSSVPSGRQIRYGKPSRTSQTKFSHTPSRKQNNLSSNGSSIISCLLLAALSFLLVSASRVLFSFRYSDITEDQYCVNSIYFATNAYSFSDSDGSFWGGVCLSEFGVTTMYASAKSYCYPGHIESGFQAVRDDCMQRAGIEMLDLGPMAAKVTEEFISNLRVVGEEESGKEVWEGPVLVAKPFFDRVFRTIDTWYWTTEKNHAYSFALQGFWVVVIAMGIVSNIWSTYSSRQRTRLGSDIEGHPTEKRSSSMVTAPFAYVVHWTRTYITTPAAFGTYHQRLFWWCTIPSRFDSIVVGAFWVLSITLSCTGYRLFHDNYFWDDYAQQLGRYASDRTGIMSYGTLPMIWIFATRNNGFLWATGWSYRTFNIYHRHVARVGTLLGIAHSIGYTYLYVEFQNWERYVRAMHKQWLYLGAMATVTMSFLLLFSHAWIRVKFYESFLMLHIVLSVATLVGLFYHTSRFAGYESYLWPVAAIWSIDRFLRLVRIAHVNYRVRFSREIVQSTETIATYNKESDVIRLEMRPVCADGSPTPGDFYYIYQPSTWTGYENHPFTVGAWSPSALDPVVSPIDKDEDEENKHTSSSSSSSSNSRTASHASSSLESLIPQSRTGTKTNDNDTTLIFWIRPYDGWTKRLRNQCLNSPTLTCNPHLILEGPYGHSSPLHTFDTVLLLAGGTGIASAVPYILSHIHFSNNRSRELRTTSLKLIWTARQKSFIEEICDEELAPALSREDFEAEFFTTRPPSQASESVLFDEHDPENKAAEAEAPKRIAITHGRPDIRASILETASGDEKGGRVAVLVCGPAGMADEARAAVAEAMRQGCREIEYFEEAFGW